MNKNITFALLGVLLSASFVYAQPAVRGELRVQASGTRPVEIKNTMMIKASSSERKDAMMEKRAEMRASSTARLQVLREQRDERRSQNLSVYQQRLDSVLERLSGFADKQAALVTKLEEKLGDKATESIDTKLETIKNNIETIKQYIDSLDTVLDTAASTTKTQAGTTIRETAQKVHEILKQNQELIKQILGEARSANLFITGEVNSNN